jgi:putative flippase GtrA
VTVLHGIYNRFQHVVHELGKFGAVGGIAYVVQLGVFNLTGVVVPHKPVVASITAGLISTLVAYVGNRYWTYRDRDSIGRGRELAMFLLVNGIAISFGVICVAISHYVLGFHGKVADNVANNFVGVALGTMFRLWTYRTFIFPKVNQDQPVVPMTVPPAAVPETGNVHQLESEKA